LPGSWSSPSGDIFENIQEKPEKSRIIGQRDVCHLQNTERKAKENI